MRKRVVAVIVLTAVLSLLFLGLAVASRSLLRLAATSVLAIGIVGVSLLVYRKQKPGIWKDALLVLAVSAGGYLLLPRFFFDDAAFILRYLDHFYEGYWYRFNTADAPVYGISGFIHGLFTGILCLLRIATPEQALVISNFTGFLFTAWFLLRIFRMLIPDQRIATLLWIIMLVAAKMYLSVATCGLETPLHLVFVTGAIYYLVARRTQLFFLFSALMIISKLDAVPVVAVAMLYYLLLYPGEIKKTTTWLNGLLWFLLPLALGLGLITLIFGSPLPQSAFAKIHYHSHSKTFWFPFLLYFVGDIYHFTLLVLAFAGWAFAIITHLRRPAAGGWAWSFFGTAFIAEMVLYYFYNPGERMMWYYAMPELLLMIQLLAGIYYTVSLIAPPQPEQKFPLAVRSVAVIFAAFLAMAAKDTYAGLAWVNKTARVTEEERQRIGRSLGGDEMKGKILICGHGYIGRWFQGYVLDISGLNSRMATDYKLNHDSVIAAVKPDYIVNHSYPRFLRIYGNRGYVPTEIYRDVTLQQYPPWVVFQRYTGTDSVDIYRLDEALNTRFLVNRTMLDYLVPSDGRICMKDTLPSSGKNMHFGLACGKESYNVMARIFSGGACMDSVNISVPSLQEVKDSVSRMMVSRSLDITGADSVVFRSIDGRYFEVSEPLFVRRK